ncbi:MAG: hypothetical protein ABIP33_11315 [Pseudolysinimonas sp.]
MARILIVPGLSVRTYAKPTAAALERAGHRVTLLAAPAWRTARADLPDYGRMLAQQLEERDEIADLVVGLSVGTQAAACAAAETDRIRRLMLISPTVDPVHRSFGKLMRRWSKGDSEGAPEKDGLQLHLGDWSHSGPIRIVTAVRSALRTPLEDVLMRVNAEVTMVHNQFDVLSTSAWVRSLAVDDAHFLEMAGAPHSWPVDDEDNFVEVVDQVLGAQQRDESTSAG